MAKLVEIIIWGVDTIGSHTWKPYALGVRSLGNWDLDGICAVSASVSLESGSQETALISKWLNYQGKRYFTILWNKIGQDRSVSQWRDWKLHRCGLKIQGILKCCVPATVRKAGSAPEREPAWRDIFTAVTRGHLNEQAKMQTLTIKTITLISNDGWHQSIGNINIILCQCHLRCERMLL